jgi:hypothetical protein
MAGDADGRAATDCLAEGVAGGPSGDRRRRGGVLPSTVTCGTVMAELPGVVSCCRSEAGAEGAGGRTIGAGDDGGGDAAGCDGVSLSNRSCAAGITPTFSSARTEPLRSIRYLAGRCFAGRWFAGIRAGMAVAPLHHSDPRSIDGGSPRRDDLMARRSARLRESLPSSDRCQRTGGARAWNCAILYRDGPSVAGSCLAACARRTGTGRSGPSDGSNVPARCTRAQTAQSWRWVTGPSLWFESPDDCAGTASGACEDDWAPFRCTCPKVMRNWSASANSATHEPNRERARNQCMALDALQAVHRQQRSKA